MNKYLFIKTVQRFGGSFYQSLASALQTADPKNFDRILAAFPELLEKYGPESSFYSVVSKEEDVKRQQDMKFIGGLALL